MPSSTAKPAKPPRVRASILVTRWFQGHGNGIDGESTERVSIPISRIELVEPYTQEIWISIAEQRHGPGACQTRINLVGDNSVVVTESVEDVDRLMNVPLGDA